MRSAILVLVSTALCCTAQSIGPQKQAKVEELFKVTKTDMILNQTLEMAASQMKASVLQQMTGTKMSPDEQKRFDEFQSKLQSIVFGALSWDKVKPIYVKVYAENFTDDELDSVIAFYKTPAGRAFIDKSPQLMNQAMGEMQKQIQSVQPQVEELINQYRQQTKTPDASKP